MYIVDTTILNSKLGYETIYIYNTHLKYVLFLHYKICPKNISRIVRIVHSDKSREDANAPPFSLWAY